MKNKRILKILVFVLPVLTLAGFIFLKFNASEIVAGFPECPFYGLLHIQCFGCGNTRSVMALLRGDIISSLKYNISPVIICVLLGLLYAELITAAFGKHRKILPRNKVFWIIFGVVLGIYFIGRNFI